MFFVQCRMPFSVIISTNYRIFLTYVHVCIVLSLYPHKNVITVTSVWSWQASVGTFQQGGRRKADENSAA